MPRDLVLQLDALNTVAMLAGWYMAALSPEQLDQLEHLLICRDHRGVPCAEPIEPLRAAGTPVRRFASRDDPGCPTIPLDDGE